jgi:mannose-6-phosphate isomerase-like protein (cupin superfamily)
VRRIDLISLNNEPLSHDSSSTKRVLIHNGTIPHLTQLAQARIAPGTCLTPHVHSDMHEIFFVLSGVGEVRGEAQALSLTPSACIHIQPSESHAFSNTGTDDLVLLYFGLTD